MVMRSRLMATGRQSLEAIGLGRRQIQENPDADVFGPPDMEGHQLGGEKGGRPGDNGDFVPAQVFDAFDSPCDVQNVARLP